MPSDIPLVTFAEAGTLSWVTRACLKSAIRCGHRVHVYAYEEIATLPDGIEQKDAEDIIPKTERFVFDGIAQPEQFGSVAPFSDMFRYRLLSMGLGCWVDWDVYFLKGLGLSGQYVLGWEGPRPFVSIVNPYRAMVGNAIMLMPQNSPIVCSLVELTSRPYPMPPWLSPILRYRVRKKLAGRAFHPGAVRYAEYGPIALNYFVRKNKLGRVVRNHKFNYPIGHTDVGQFLKNDRELREALPADSETVHLWHSAFRYVTRDGIPEGSFAARLREESLDA